MKIAIVGSGPAAVATHQTLMQNNFSGTVEILDVADTLTPNRKDSSLPRNLKGFRGSTQMYKHLELLESTRPNNRYLLRSQSKGGFSVVWGAVTDSAIEKYGVSTLKIDTVESHHLSSPKIEILSSKKTYCFSQQELFLAVDSKKCISCGECLLGCQYNAIWSAKNYWDSLDKVNYVDKTQIAKIEIVNSSKITLVNEQNGEIGTYDYVFLAAGSLESLRILMKSNLISDSVLFQNDLTILPFISIKKLGKTKLNLSLASCGFNVEENSNVVAYVQMYTNLTYVKKLITHNKWTLKFVPNIIWRKMSSHLGVAFIYYDAKLSRTMSASKKGGSLSINSTDSLINMKKRRNIRRAIIKFLRNKSLIPIVSSRKLEPLGRSFHLGALQNLHHLTMGTSGILSQRVFCVDGLSLEELETGHITYSIMSNASKITNHFLKMNP